MDVITDSPVLVLMLEFLSARDTVVLQSCQKQTYFSRSHQRKRRYIHLVLNPLMNTAKQRRADIKSLRLIASILPKDFILRRWSSNDYIEINDDTLNKAESNLLRICELAKENVLVVDSVYRIILLQGLHHPMHITPRRTAKTQNYIEEPDLTLGRCDSSTSKCEDFEDALQQWQKEIMLAKTTKLINNSVLLPPSTAAPKYEEIWW